MTKICRHCKKADVKRPRGLCWTCYYAPGVRDLYPTSPKYKRSTDSAAPSTPPGEPTCVCDRCERLLRVLAGAFPPGVVAEFRCPECGRASFHEGGGPLFWALACFVLLFVVGVLSGGK